ncbi:MAG: hypothetical protein K0U98_06710 [Deltaproteobacteria bacterium]|nr:hypothetical protein [Deltaproteobacteria bacterium]
MAYPAVSSPRFRHGSGSTYLTSTLLALALVLTPNLVEAQEFTLPSPDGCTFSSTGNNTYFPLQPGLSLLLEEEGEDVTVRTTVTSETMEITGITTRIFESREFEEDELVEISRKYFASCRETGDVWFFGEDFEEYEDGEIVDEGTEWRAGEDGAQAGILMPNSPMLGARYTLQRAPGESEERAEVVGLGGSIEVPAGTANNVLETVETDAEDPGPGDPKLYAPGLGNIIDEDLELVEFTLPPCQPDDHTLCLQDGRFKVTADWTTPDGTEGDGNAILPSAESGEFWFFNAGNTELIVKILDACDVPAFNSFWVFAAGLTNVEVTIEVTDTLSGMTKEYENDQGDDFAPILDTAAFATCP